MGFTRRSQAGIIFTGQKTAVSQKEVNDMNKGKKYGARAIEKARLEAWKNPSMERDYTVEITYPEFTCVCPRSGYPDFAAISVVYVPDKSVVELKSLKLYLNSFRSVPISHEAVTNRIFEDLNTLLEPKKLDVVADFNVRGNVKTVVKVSL